MDSILQSKLLLTESAHVCDERFDFVIGKFVSERFHCFLTVDLLPLFNRFVSFRVIEFGLDFRICIILGPGLLAHPGLAATIWPVWP